MEIVGIKPKAFWIMVHITQVRYEYLKKIYTVTTEFNEIKEDKEIKLLAKEYLFPKIKHDKPVSQSS